MLDSAVQRLMSAAEAVLPQEVANDARNNLQAALRGALDRMDLVTREEFDIQRGVLAKTRARLQELESRVDELESILSPPNKN